jgi:polysaccharide export outer membrane protein
MLRDMLSTVVSLMFCVLAVPIISQAQTESLLIGPGDLIQVDVMDTPELEQQVRVTDSGEVSLAYIGSIHVAGEAPSQAAADIQAILVRKNIMLHPQVTVRVQEYATQDVSILGQVRSPGAYPVTTPQSILKVLALAGGLTEIADRHVTINRVGSNEQLTYYVANDPREALADLPIVHPGDTVLVPRAPIVYVMGDVSKPGGYPIVTNNSELTVLQAISMAGSTNKTSIQSRVRLIRRTPTGTIELPVRLDAIEKGKSPDIALQSNDILYVPFSWMKNAAMSSASIVSSVGSAAIYTLQ